MGIQQNREYDLIDVFRLFFAICIVALHTNVLYSRSADVQWYVTALVFRLAVPFFFVTSGYFLGKKLYSAGDASAARREIFRYVSRLLPPFLFWSTINATLNNYIRYSGTPAAEWIGKAVQRFIFYPDGAMWYVLASIVGALIIGLF